MSDPKDTPVFTNADIQTPAAIPVLDDVLSEFEELNEQDLSALDSADVINPFSDLAGSDFDDFDSLEDFDEPEPEPEPEPEADPNRKPSLAEMNAAARRVR